MSYKVIVYQEPTSRGNTTKNRPIKSTLATIGDVNDHLKLIFANNKKWSRIQILHGKEVIREWVR